MVRHPKTSSGRKMLPPLGMRGMGKNNVVEVMELESQRALQLQERNCPAGAGSTEKNRPLREL